jgi:hypothetical protein
MAPEKVHDGVLPIAKTTMNWPVGPVDPDVNVRQPIP